MNKYYYDLEYKIEYEYFFDMIDTHQERFLTYLDSKYTISNKKIEEKILENYNIDYNILIDEYLNNEFTYMDKSFYDEDLESEIIYILCSVSMKKIKLLIKKIEH